jgi:hypothetical protein
VEVGERVTHNTHNVAGALTRCGTSLATHNNATLLSVVVAGACRCEWRCVRAVAGRSPVLACGAIRTCRLRSALRPMSRPIDACALPRASRTTRETWLRVTTRGTTCALDDDCDAHARSDAAGLLLPVPTPRAVADIRSDARLDLPVPPALLRGGVAQAGGVSLLPHPSTRAVPVMDSTVIRPLPHSEARQRKKSAFVLPSESPLSYYSIRSFVRLVARSLSHGVTFAVAPREERRCRDQHDSLLYVPKRLHSCDPRTM